MLEVSPEFNAAGTDSPESAIPATRKPQSSGLLRTALSPLHGHLNDLQSGIDILVNIADRLNGPLPQGDKAKGREGIVDPHLLAEVEILEGGFHDQLNRFKDIVGRLEEIA